MSDLIELLGEDGSISENEIVAKLEERYSKGFFHTRIGYTNLIAVNPHKRVFIPAHGDYDLERICTDNFSLQPHPFEIASAAYLHMVRAVEDQVILTCGESGSGKTEVLRQTLQQILHLSQQTDPHQKIHSDILSAELILECFGNAQTAGNKNSTRYSRYTELRFNDDGTIVGSKIVEYLFESSRVSACPQQDCNFHIFQMMLDVTNSNKEERTKWRLHSTDSKSYAFLGTKATLNPDTASALPRVAALKQNLKSLSISKRNINDIFNTLAGILHLGNIEFTMEDQGRGYGAYVKNRAELEFAAKLFSVSPDALESAITTASCLEGDIVCAAYLDVPKSVVARNALASVLYHLVFKWIIEQINSHLGSSRLGGSFVSQIGLLDIAGFEDRTPNANGFDQFQSNYTNEKLQTFVLTRAINFIPFAVAADGVKTPDSSSPLPVDTQILDFYDNPSVGLFEIIDHETYTHGEQAKDSVILAQLDATFGGTTKSRFYETCPNSAATSSCFKIKHYTKTSVTYDVSGFVAKNRNNCYTEVINLFNITLGTTTGKQKPKSFIAGLFTESVVKTVLHPKDASKVVSARPAAPQAPTQSSPDGGSRKKSGSMLLSSASLQSSNSLTRNSAVKKQKIEQATSALSCLKASVDALLEAINEMRSWTIICITPNELMASDNFLFAKVLHQITAHKVRDVTQASKIGYTVGIEFTDFMDRFGKLHADVSVSEQNSKDNCLQILKAEEWKPEIAQCGLTRIFLIEEAWRGLESRLDSTTGEADDSEGRKIHLILDSKGVQRTPGFIKKSMGSLNELNDNLQDPTKTVDQLDIKIGDLTDIEPKQFESKKSKSFFSLYREKSDSDDEEDREEAAEVAASENATKLAFKPVERMSRSRRQWVYFTWAVTWWIPSYLLRTVGKMSQPSVQMAWREKVAICFIVVLMSGVMLFFVQGLGKLLCPLEDYFSLSELAAHSQWGGLDMFVAYNGYIYDITGFNHPGGSIIDAAGKDVSQYFPRYNITTGNPLSTSCGFLTTVSLPIDAISQRDELSVDQNFIERELTLDVLERDLTYTFNPPANLYPAPYDNDTSALFCSNPSLSYQGWCHPTAIIDSLVLKNEVKNFGRVGVLAYPSTEISKHDKLSDWWVAINGKIYNVSIIAGPNTIYSIDSKLFNTDFLGPPGSDASSNSSKLSPTVQACFDEFLLIGFVDERASSAGCSASAYILYSVTGIMVAVMVVKFLAALQLGPSPNPEGNDRFVIMQVPCYNEGEGSLTKTIESLATFDYDDTRKLLFIVSDGMIKSAGSDLSTPDIVLQILGVDKSVQKPEGKSYLAIGRGLKEHNKAKVYSGLYNIQGRYIPFIYVCKVGKDGETSKPGNRGKRDSQMILMKFLNRVHFGTPMSPLELEMYHQIKNIIGVDPFLYEYCLMVDADTRVEPQSLNRLISCMVNDVNTMGICGETRIENENESWVTMMQVYEYYISHHLAKAFESLFGSVTCLPGCFCMYRMRTPKKAPLLISNQILNEYKDINVNTLHKQNLLSLGEDRFLTTLMLKHFPEYRNKFTPDAFIQQAQAPIISLVMMASAYGMQAVIFLLKGQYQHIGWMVISILAMPCFNAYWHFDDFKWGNTRKGAAADTGGGHGSGNDDEELIPLDRSTVPLVTWEAYEAIMIEKGDPTFHHSSSITEPYQPQMHVGSLQGSVQYALASTPLDIAQLPSSQSRQFSKDGAKSQSERFMSSNEGDDRWVDQRSENFGLGNSPSIKFAPWTSGIPEDNDIAKYVKQIIETTDLSQLSKKKVREAVNLYFDQDLSARKTFINETVERVIKDQNI
ncbi:hypothetical protein HK100_003361 [Physocladia obscura]|uniref:chitin synthase n=1 Tax=Physocladia obscura TaxID=109957 RepID=A0AAD5XEN3_9FUNG|nr:hypothetical protein HK100_003361 [Physocladia obscura]